MSKQNNNLLLLGFGAVAYFIYQKNRGVSLLESGCVQGGRYFNRRLKLYSDFCPLSYVGSLWFVIQGKLVPESEVKAFGFIRLDNGAYVHQNDYNRLLEQFRIAKQQNVALSLNVFINTVKQGYNIITNQGDF